jgi:hypothetical protein
VCAKTQSKNKQVSNTLTAALWSLDFLPTLSQAGCVRMNFHGGPGGP